MAERPPASRPRAASPGARLELVSLGEVVWLGAALSAAVALGGCARGGAPGGVEGDDAPAPVHREPAQEVAVAAAETPPARLAAPSPTTAAEPAADVAPVDPQPPGAAPEPAATRDLVAELTEGFGRAPECATDALAAHPGSHTLTVSVRIGASGAVSAASVQARGIPQASLACLRKHAEAIRFDAPVDGAPLTVRASFPLDVRPAPTPPTEPGFVLPPGARAPGIVLPAQVGEGLPPGAVPPRRTLPATGDGTSDGRPEGFVEPSRTLPARGQTGRSRIITGGE